MDREIKLAHAKPDVGATASAGPDLNDINRRKAEEARKDRKASYKIAGIMSAVLVATITVIYLSLIHI